jgi:hypothetical protein
MADAFYSNRRVDHLVNRVKQCKRGQRYKNQNERGQNSSNDFDESAVNDTPRKNIINSAVGIKEKSSRKDDKYKKENESYKKHEVVVKVDYSFHYWGRRVLKKYLPRRRRV